MLTKDPPNWQEFFMECSHYLLLYRLHMVGSFFTREPDHIESFVAIGGVSFLFDVLVKHADTFRQDEILLIESVILLILDQYAVKQEKNVRLSSKEINGVLDIILNMSSHAQIITKSLAILQTIGVESESDVDQEKFHIPFRILQKMAQFGAETDCFEQFLDPLRLVCRADQRHIAGLHNDQVVDADCGDQVVGAA